MILLNQTYETCTQDDIEIGEPSERGFDFEDVPYTFKELVDYIHREGFTECSAYPAHGETYEWLSTESRQSSYYEGEHKKSLHFSRNNKPRSAKYWRKAFIAAGIIKI